MQHAARRTGLPRTDKRFSLPNPLIYNPLNISSDTLFSNGKIAGDPKNP